VKATLSIPALAISSQLAAQSIAEETWSHTDNEIGEGLGVYLGDKITLDGVDDGLGASG